MVKYFCVKYNVCTQYMLVKNWYEMYTIHTSKKKISMKFVLNMYNLLAN